MAAKSQEVLIDEAFNATGPANAFVKSLKAGVVNEALAMSFDAGKRRANQVSYELDRRGAFFKATVAEQAEAVVDTAAGAAGGAIVGAAFGALIGALGGGVGAIPGAILGAVIFGGLLGLNDEVKAVGRILSYPLRRMSGRIKSRAKAA